MQLSSRSTNWIAVGIALAAALLAFASVWNDAIIIDEDPHIGAGYSYITQQDMRLNPEHPPLAKDLAGLALTPLGLNHDAFSTPAWTRDINGQWDFGRALIFNSGLSGQGNDADLITRVAKIPAILLFALTGLFIFYWARKEYGPKAGLIAITLFLFSPTVMAHGRFVTTDIPAALGVVSATYFFLRWLKDSSRKNFWWAAVFFGIALLMKFSTVLLGPFFILLTLLYNWKAVWKTFVIMLMGFVLVVWPVYAFHVWHYPPERQHHDTEDLLRSFGNRTLADPVVWASNKPLLRAPAQYGLGLLMVVQRSAGGNTVYFRGNVTTSAGPTYFPIVYFIKEPLSWFALLLIALIAAFSKFKFQKPNIKEHVTEIAMLLWLAIYWFTSIRSTLNIGVRHLMPIYPFIIILVSGQVAQLRHRVARWAVYILLACFTYANLSIFPYYLTYFNHVAGGPTGGYRWVVDSNLDWGQDLKRFGRWTQDNNIKKIEFDYFGWADQRYYLGDRFVWLTAGKYKSAEDFKARNQTDGWLAVSATFLQNEATKQYSWLANREPVTVIGNSIFVYRIQ